MNISECHAFLEFFIDKFRGEFYTSQQLDDLIDAGQMAVYNDYQARASISQRIKDALSPFKEKYPLTPDNTLNGLVQIPSNYNGHTYLNLLSLEIRYPISGRGITKYFSLENANEDEISAKKNSMLDPVTASNPVMEQTGKATFQLTPAVQYFGTVTYYRRPVKPVFVYTTISGRIQVYDAVNSVQLEWMDTQHMEILLKSLASIGINIGAGDIAQWAEQHSQNNYLRTNNL